MFAAAEQTENVCPCLKSLYTAQILYSSPHIYSWEPILSWVKVSSPFLRQNYLAHLKKVFLCVWKVSGRNPRAETVCSIRGFYVR